MCENLSLTHICSFCQTQFLKPSIYKRKIHNNIEVISFYKYTDIKELLHTKHTDLGFYIYKILAKNSFEQFSKGLFFNERVASIAVDDHVKNGYSHTAILNHALKSNVIKPQNEKLRAKNSISYSGKSKEFRIMNPRDFIFKNFRSKDVIIVDDIITTGSTLNQSIQLLQKNGKNVLFCLTLADASLK